MVTKVGQRVATVEYALIIFLPLFIFVPIREAGYEGKDSGRIYK